MFRRFSTHQEIPENGLYRVRHKPHRLVDSIMLIRGDKFPRCSQCTGEVVFELMFSLSSGTQSKPVHISEVPLAEAAVEPRTSS